VKRGDLMRTRFNSAMVWDGDLNNYTEISVYPRKFELLLVLGGVTRDGYHHRVLTSGGIVGYVLGSEILPV
jgi:hypothetical protein